MKKVAHIKTTYLEVSETFFYQFALYAKNYEPHVFAENIKNFEQFPINNIHSFPPYTKKDFLLSAGGRLFSNRHYGFERRLRILIEKVKPDILHAHWGPVGVYVLPVAQSYHLPLITSFYGFDTSYEGVSKTMPSPRKLIPFGLDGFWAKSYSTLFNGGSAFVSFGEKMRDDLIALGCPSDKIQDIHSGIDLSQRELAYRSWNKENEIKLLMVNRLVEKKGVSFAIESLSELVKQYPQLKLRIVGGGPLEDKLREQSKKLRVEKNVTWLGMLPYEEVLQEMSNAHIFLSPSIKLAEDEEGGINTTIIDALALGIPTIATDESGSQLIFSDKTGLIVREKDSVDLTEKLKYLIETPKLAKDFAKNGRKIVEENFDINKQVNKMEGLYDQLLSV